MCFVIKYFNRPDYIKTINIKSNDKIEKKKQQNKNYYWKLKQPHKNFKLNYKCVKQITESVIHTQTQLNKESRIVFIWKKIFISNIIELFL